MTVGERLQEALDYWGQGVMAFRDEMKERLKGKVKRASRNRPRSIARSMNRRLRCPYSNHAQRPFKPSGMPIYSD